MRMRLKAKGSALDDGITLPKNPLKWSFSIHGSHAQASPILQTHADGKNPELRIFSPNRSDPSGWIYHWFICPLFAIRFLLHGSRKPLPQLSSNPPFKERFFRRWSRPRRFYGMRQSLFQPILPQRAIRNSIEVSSNDLSACVTRWNWSYRFHRIERPT